MQVLTGLYPQIDVTRKREWKEYGRTELAGAKEALCIRQGKITTIITSIYYLPSSVLVALHILYCLILTKS